MKSYNWKIAKSAKGNIYLAAELREFGVKTADICLFSGKQPFFRRMQKNQVALYNALSSAFRQQHKETRGVPPIKLSDGPMRAGIVASFGKYTIAFTNNGMINNTHVGNPGSYYIENGFAYNIDVY